MHVSRCVLPAVTQSPSQRGTVSSVFFVPPFACSSRYLYCSSDEANCFGGGTTFRGGPYPAPNPPFCANDSDGAASTSAAATHRQNRVFLVMAPSSGLQNAFD